MGGEGGQGAAQPPLQTLDPSEDQASEGQLQETEVRNSNAPEVGQPALRSGKAWDLGSERPGSSPNSAL